MTTHLIDLFLSLKGRISRREWVLGSIAVAAAAISGILLFNVDTYDESANAVAAAPTMAAFLWAIPCLFSLTALCAKRLRGRMRWLAAGVAVPGALLICGWGFGYFQTLLAGDGQTAAFSLLVALSLPAFVACARNTGGA